MGEQTDRDGMGWVGKCTKEGSEGSKGGGVQEVWLVSSGMRRELEREALMLGFESWGAAGYVSPGAVSRSRCLGHFWGKGIGGVASWGRDGVGDSVRRCVSCALLSVFGIVGMVYYLLRSLRLYYLKVNVCYTTSPPLVSSTNYLFLSYHRLGD